MRGDFRVGVISSVHGIHGECKIYPTTDDIKRFDNLKKVYAQGRGKDIELKISHVKYFKNMVICKFEGIDTPEDMQLYRNMDLMIDRCDAIPLNKGEHYISDLLGLAVNDEDGTRLGIVNDIYDTGANPVMEVLLDSGKKVLLPYIKQCILEVSLDKKYIRVHVIDGLLDL